MASKGTKTQTRPKSKIENKKYTQKEIPENVLDISTLIDPDPLLGCKINGEWYGYARRDLWSIRDRTKWGKYWERVQQIESKREELEDDDIKLYLDGLTNLIKLAVPDLPLEMARDIDLESKFAIILDFLARTMSQTAGHKLLAGFGKEKEGTVKEQVLGTLQSIGDELSRNWIRDGDTDGNTG